MSVLRKLIPALLVGWALLVTLLRALRTPNDWAESHWLINYYEFGFIKRALPGSVLATFLDPLADPALTQRVIEGIAFAGLSLFICVMGYGMARILLRNSFSAEGKSLLLLFATSPWVVMAAHLSGYFDLVIFFLATGAMVLVMRGWVWAAATLLGLGVMVHETMVLLGLPSVLFAAILQQASGPTGANGAMPWQRILKKQYPLLLLPGILFAAIFLNHSLCIDAAILQEQIDAWLAQFDFIADNLRLFISTSFTVSFKDYYESSEGKLWLRLSWGGFVLKTGLPVLAALWFCWRRLSPLRDAKTLLVLLLASVLLPLSLHLIAWDSSRIWTYPLVVAFWAVWACSELPPDASGLKPLPRVWAWGVIVLVVWQMFSRIPLMDYAEEVLSTPQRLLLYGPVLAWALWCLHKGRSGSGMGPSPVS